MRGAPSAITVSMICKMALRSFVGSPWQLFGFTPFHATATVRGVHETDYIRLSLDDFAERYVHPAVLTAMESKTKLWGRTMELPPYLDGACEIFDGVMCRVVRSWFDLIFDFECERFPRLNNGMESYFWLGEEAEVV